jgi:protein-S-isoprenylcysteine O-methyltransferase Ste14
MTPAADTQVQLGLSDPDNTTRLGAWLFRHRSIMPVPLAIAVLTLRVGELPPSTGLIGLGIGITFLSECLRLWAVHHIGVISRTRSDRLGPLIATGPFALVRNPLYLGNIGLWAGFALTARLVWVAAVIVALLGIEYHAIVRWEERLLEARLGDAYRAYSARVPRWVPRFTRPATASWRVQTVSSSSQERPSPADMASASFSWRDTLFSERGTLLAIAVGYVVLSIKARF